MNRGELVLDPFGGFGTTFMAAEKTGRPARRTEFDPLYRDVIVRRFETFASKREAHGDGENNRGNGRGPDAPDGHRGRLWASQAMGGGPVIHLDRAEDPSPWPAVLLAPFKRRVHC